jgi:8-oxo-dGTP pyrophosphatase MutT (NUDIX family)
MPIEISAGAVVYRMEDNNPEYLLLHYESGHWDFPKGNIERGEGVEETVAREVKEETGIVDIKFIENFKEEIKYFYRRQGRTIFKKVIFLLAKTQSREVKLSYEHVGYDWLPYEDALARLTFDNAKEILRKANGFLSRQ